MFYQKKRKGFEYSPLVNELKKQTSIAEKQYPKLDNTYEIDRIKERKIYNKKYNRSNLIYNSKFSFYEHYNTLFNSTSLESKFKFLVSFYCSVESCVNKTIIWLYVCVSESLFNFSIVSRLIYTNCVIDSICTPFALFLHRFNQDFRESIHVEVVRVLCAIFKIQWF